MNNLGSTIFNQEIPIKYEVDVMVAGGGPAGIAAAITAARQGMKVYLVDRESCFGGMGTSGLVPMFCPFTDGVNFLAGGIGREVVDKCIESGAAGPDELRSMDEKLASYITIRAEKLKQVYDNMIIDANVDFTFKTTVIHVQKESKSNVSMALCSAKSGIFAVKAKMFIDCTGDGDLAALAEAAFKKGNNEGDMMAGSLCSIWTGINWESEKIKRWDDGRYLNKAFAEGIFEIEDPSLPGMLRIGEITGGGNIGHAFGVDATDEISVTKAFVEQRRRLVQYENYYKKYLKGYENMELIATGQVLGIRESRRIMGDYVLNLNDFKDRAVFDDEIGRYSYQVDMHASKPGKEASKKNEEIFEKLKYKKGESYGIPYRTLTPKGLTNVLVAGRCISCDRYMLGSVRVMPGSFITGQAAGMAAAVAIENKTDIRGFDVGELQQRLKIQGAYLPNC